MSEQDERELWSKIKALNDHLWENHATKPAVDSWLDNFKGRIGRVGKERFHALFLLSNFMYFGMRQIRELLRSMYRDRFRCAVVTDLSRRHAQASAMQLEKSFNHELRLTRFLGMGNPSESGSFLLYFFRQENSLRKSLFIHTHQLFTRRRSRRTMRLREQKVRRFVFLDDFCGSGLQGLAYSRELVEEIKRLNRNAWTAYYVLFGTKAGLDVIRRKTRFDAVECVYELDESYKCFARQSRYFVGA